MTLEQTAAEINARCTRAMIRALGLAAGNDSAKYQGIPPFYSSTDFENIIADEGVGTNDVTAALQEVNNG